MSSLVGIYFMRQEPPASYPTRFNFDQTFADADIVLIAREDTIRLKTDPSGEFNIQHIPSGRVFLAIERKRFDDPSVDWCKPYAGSFELMPGKNVILIPTERVGEDVMLKSESPVVTMEGDTWIYYPAEMKTREVDFGIDMLQNLPGAEYNKKEKGLYISGDAVRRTFANGAFVFGLKP
ncbi:MAG: hypothetical protein J6P46_05485 [Bacteroidales bacterium]|nr:hypothetical protein [Bacteroidales bacterium]